MVDYTLLPSIDLSAETYLQVTAFPTGTPFVGVRFESRGHNGVNFANFSLYLAAAKAAEYGAALIEAAKSSGWVEPEPVSEPVPEPAPAEAEA